MEPDDPFEEEQDVLGASNDGGYEEPRNAGAAEVGPSSHQPGQASEDGDAEPPNDDAAEAEHQPCRPGLQPKLNTVLCREASDVAPGIGTFARAEASLLFEGTKYNWPMTEEEEEFDGAGPFLAARMQTCIANATGAHFQAFSDTIVKITRLDTTQPILKALPNAPRDHDANATSLVLVTGEGRYLYTNKRLADGTIVPISYAVCEPSEALLCSVATMHFSTDCACPCGAKSRNHAATAKFNVATGVPMLSIEHTMDNKSFWCSLQPANGWEASPSDLGRVLQVSTWPEHEVRALQAEYTPEFVAPYETEVAALALFDKTYKVTILVDVLDAKLGGAIVKCGAVAKPALFCVDMNTRLWGMHELTQSTLIDNQTRLFCNHAMAMAKRSDDELKFVVQRLADRNENDGWPNLLAAKKPPKKDGGDDGSEAEDDAEALAAAAVEKQKTAISKLRNGLLHPHLRSWYDNVALNQNHAGKQLLKRIAHRGLGSKRDISPFNPSQLLPFENGQLVDFGQRGSGGFVRRIEQTDMITKTLPFALKDLDSTLLPNLDTATEAEMCAFGQRLGDEEAALEYRKFLKLYFNYDGGVMFRLSVVAKALVGDTFLSALYVQLGARKSNGDFIQGAGKGMPSKLDQDALGAYAESCPLSLLFYKEKLDGASPGFAKLEAKRYVLIDEANQQQNQSGGDQVINPNMLRRLVPQGPEVKLSARQLYEGHLEFYAQIISLVVNLNNMYPGLFEGRRAQAIHLSTVFLPGDEYDRWVTANHDANVLSAKWRDSVIAVAGTDGSAKNNVQKKANGNPYSAEMWKRMASVHLTCATLLARRCVKTSAWPAVPKVNEDLTNLLLQEEANRASSTGNGIDAATLQRLNDAWHEFAVPCETGLKGGKSTVPHACNCTRDGHERWCVVGVNGFSTWLSTTDKPLAKAIQVKGATHMITLLKQAVPGLDTAHCDKAARAPTLTRYAQEHPRNAIVHWRAKSEGKLNPKKPSKAPVARADKPTTKRKTATFGAEQGSAKKQKPIVVRGLSGAGAHDGPQTQEDIDRARGARKEREKKKEQKDTPKKIRSINTEVSETSEEEESDDDGSQDETSDEEEDEDEDEEDSQNESSDEE
eukprot:scaffold28195_cov70-Phaeocystis_antarctica.AAC.6